MIVAAFIVAFVLAVLVNVMQWRHFRRFEDGFSSRESRVSALRVLVCMIPMCLSNAWFGMLLMVRVETPEGFIFPLVHLVVLISSFLVSASLGVRCRQASR